MKFLTILLVFTIIRANFFSKTFDKFSKAIKSTKTKIKNPFKKPPKIDHAENDFKKVFGRYSHEFPPGTDYDNLDPKTEAHI